ncbi:MAG: site-specific DNA-methyltransferase [Chromatiaceae bacterium]|nr:site-specific DNA-methyltransferase [Chromatiaceae bacterium]
MPEPVVIGPATLLQGDCLAVMPTLAADSLDAIVTDPPYGLSFMGKDWDHGIPGPAFWVEALRVAKPGAHLLAFGGSRTFHRLVCAIEDAGWEVRDVLMWVYGSGFPKSLDVSKALDKRERAEREVIGKNESYLRRQPNGWQQQNRVALGARLNIGSHDVTAPATAAARQWAGWGTALKPAYEPILLARKPLAGTVAANVLAHGTGALNIDGCRVESGPSPADDRRTGKPTCQPGRYGATITDRTTPERWAEPRPGEQLGRFPANLIHDGSPEVLVGFPETGPSPSIPVKQGGHHWKASASSASNRTPSTWPLRPPGCAPPMTSPSRCPCWRSLPRPRPSSPARPPAPSKPPSSRPQPNPRRSHIIPSR